MPTDYIVLAVLAILFNVLDSVTTHIALNKLPVELRAKEANPLMRPLLLRKPILATVIKQGLVVLLVLWSIAIQSRAGLVFIAVALGLVVINNSVVIIGRVKTHTKVPSPLYKVQKKLRIPDSLSFLFVILIIGGIAWVVANYLVG